MHPEEPVRNIHFDLIQRAREGEQAVLKELYNLYSRAMFNTALRIVSDRMEAEDILQESFISAFKNIHSYRGESTFGAWLKKIVVNRSLNAIRSRITFEDAEVLADLSVAEQMETDDQKFPFTIQQVKQALHQLADGYRTVFSLYFLEGYDHSEISEILGIDENTSKSQLSRAKKKILVLLQTQTKKL
ncbi:MAG: RNA polymerase sigma factor [Cyclobacteriaceae bacterium]